MYHMYPVRLYSSDGGTDAPENCFGEAAVQGVKHVKK